MKGAFVQRQNIGTLLVHVCVLLSKCPKSAHVNCILHEFYAQCLQQIWLVSKGVLMTIVNWPIPSPMGAPDKLPSTVGIVWLSHCQACDFSEFFLISGFFFTNLPLPQERSTCSLYCVQSSSFLFVWMWSVCKSSQEVQGGFVLETKGRPRPAAHFGGCFTIIKSHTCIIYSCFISALGIYDMMCISFAHIVWSVVAERSISGVVRMWVRIPAWMDTAHLCPWARHLTIIASSFGWDVKP